MSKRGNFVAQSSSDLITNLNSLARVLCKSGSTYNAVVKAHDSNNIYAAYPEGAKNNKAFAFSQDQINQLIGLLTTLIDGELLLDLKVELFAKEYKLDNAFILRMIQEEKSLLKAQLSKGEINQEAYDQAFTTLKKASIGSEEFKQFVVENFDNFLDTDELHLLKEFLNDSLDFIKVPISTEYVNVHSEARGIHYASTQEQGATSYHTGLATRLGKDIGFCAGCTLEVEVNGYNIERTGDFPYNLPQGQYSPSPLISDKDYFFHSLILKVARALFSHEADDKVDYNTVEETHTDFVLEAIEKIKGLCNDTVLNDHFKTELNNICDMDREIIGGCACIEHLENLQSSFGE